MQQGGGAYTCIIIQIFFSADYLLNNSENSAKKNAYLNTPWETISSRENIIKTTMPFLSSVIIHLTSFFLKFGIQSHSTLPFANVMLVHLQPHLFGALSFFSKHPCSGIITDMFVTKNCTTVDIKFADPRCKYIFIPLTADWMFKKWILVISNFFESLLIIGLQQEAEMKLMRWIKRGKMHY